MNSKKAACCLLTRKGRTLKKNAGHNKIKAYRNSHRGEISWLVLDAYCISSSGDPVAMLQWCSSWHLLSKEQFMLTVNYMTTLSFKCCSMWTWLCAQKKQKYSEMIKTWKQLHILSGLEHVRLPLVSFLC